MTELTTPIFVNAKGDVQLYESVREAELALEPVDVQNSEFTVYDARGLRINPGLDVGGRHVRLDPAGVTEERPDELATILRDFLITVRGWDEELVDETEDQIQRMNLGQLISLVRSAREKGTRRRGSWRLWRRRLRKS